MRFSKIFTAAFVAVAVTASPVSAPVDEKRLVNLKVLATGVEALLTDVVKDVEAIAGDIGFDLTQTLADLSLTLSVKRDVEERGLTGAVLGVETLLAHVLKDVVVIASEAGISVFSLLASIGL